MLGVWDTPRTTPERVLEGYDRLVASIEEQVQQRIRETYLAGKEQGCGIRVFQHPGMGMMGVYKVEVAPDVRLGRAEVVVRA